MLFFKVIITFTLNYFILLLIVMKASHVYVMIFIHLNLIQCIVITVGGKIFLTEDKYDPVVFADSNGASGMFITGMAVK